MDGQVGLAEARARSRSEPFLDEQEPAMKKQPRKMTLNRDTIIRLDPRRLDQQVAGGIPIRETASCQGGSTCPTCYPCHLT
jgi:hypothetical protein